MQPSQMHLIPANVLVDIASTSVFGAKFVELVPPAEPSPQHLQPGAVLQNKSVTVEICRRNDIELSCTLRTRDTYEAVPASGENSRHASIVIDKGDVVASGAIEVRNCQFLDTGCSIDEH